VSSAASHLDLLAMARCMREAVERDDTAGLHAALTRLRTAVVSHVHAEHPQLDALPDAAAALALEGQRRLLGLLTDLVFTRGDGDGVDECNCVVRAAEIELAVRRQAKLEAALLRRHPSARNAGT
jgi:hypothetical protein